MTTSTKISAKRNIIEFNIESISEQQFIIWSGGEFVPTTVTPSGGGGGLGNGSVDRVIDLGDTITILDEHSLVVVDYYEVSGTLDLQGDSVLEILGGANGLLNVTTINSATYDLLVSDNILNVIYTTTGAVTSLTLPTAQTTRGRSIIIKDSGGNASANNITIDTEGSELIDGLSTKVISVDYDSINLYSDGTDWFIY